MTCRDQLAARRPDEMALRVRQTPVELTTYPREWFHKAATNKANQWLVGTVRRRVRVRVRACCIRVVVAVALKAMSLDMCSATLRGSG